MPTEAEQPRKQILINAATENDLLGIKKILRATIRTPYGVGDVDETEVQMELERITRALSLPEEGKTLIARDQQGEALGLAFFGKPDSRITDFTGSDPETTMELRLLYLDPSKRGQGLGSYLLQAAEDEMREKGTRKIELVSGPRYILIGSGRFYSKRGYSLVGTIENYFEGEYWAKVYQKELL